jgi:hypothetical protein
MAGTGIKMPDARKNLDLISGFSHVEKFIT